MQDTTLPEFNLLINMLLFCSSGMENVSSVTTDTCCHPGIENVLFEMEIQLIIDSVMDNMWSN